MKLDLAARDDAPTDELESGIRLAAGARLAEHLDLVGILGQGSSAIVYEAVNTKLQASVAVKVLEVEPELRENAKARLLNEARICARLEDPRIPRIYDVGELPDGTPYTVMEKVSGSSLEAMLQQGPLALATARQIIDELLHALEAVHAAGIVHRDVKPANIMVHLDSDGGVRLRLMDFGICTSMRTASESEPGAPLDDAELAQPTSRDLRLTQQGTIVGTPHYMAPEQIGAGGVDGRTDLYAAALVFYEMLTGESPFAGETLGQLFASVLDPTPLTERKPHALPPRLKPLLDRALHPEPAQRFPSARALREAVREALRDASPALPTAARPAMLARSRPLALAALLVCGGVLVSLVIGVGDSPASTAPPAAKPHVAAPSALPPAGAACAPPTGTEATDKSRALAPPVCEPQGSPALDRSRELAPPAATPATPLANRERLARDAAVVSPFKPAPKSLDGLPPNPY